MSGMHNTQQKININSVYQYDADDMKDILQRSIDAVATKDAPNINITCFVDKDGNLDALLKQFIARLDKDKTPKRIELISCLVNEYWVGVIFRFDEHGEIEQAEYYDSFSPVNESTSKRIKNIFCKIPPKSVKCFLQEDQNKANSGPYLIENLKLALFLQLSPSAEYVLDPVKVRIEHLSLYKGNDLEKFQAKQNRGINMPNTTKKSMALQSLFDLNDAVLELVPDLEERIADYESNQRLMSLFESICDKDLRLKLQFNKIADNKDLTPFLHRSQNDVGARNHAARHGQAGFTLGYAGASYGGLVARAAGYFGMASPAFMLFEPLIAPVAVIGLGLTYAGRCVTESMSTDITRALELSNKSELDESQKNIKSQAEGILNHQFGIGRSVISDLPYRMLRGTRYCSTPQDQYAFAHLLRAQLVADRKDEAAFIYLHNDVFMNTNNNDYKVMSIIMMLNILYGMPEWEVQPFSLALQNKMVEALVSTLHGIDKEFVDLYLLYVLREFNRFMQNELRKIEQSKLSVDDLSILQDKVKRLAELSSLHCLRYSRVLDKDHPTGRLIEITCIRMQELLHCLMHDLYREHSIAEKADQQLEQAKDKEHQINTILTLEKILARRWPGIFNSLLKSLKDSSEVLSKITAIINISEASNEVSKSAPAIVANADANSRSDTKSDSNEVQIALPERVKCLLYYFEQAGQAKPRLLPSPPPKPNESVERDIRTCLSFRNIT